MLAPGCDTPCDHGLDVDLARFIRPGDRVVLAQGTAEPQTLARLLVAQRHRFPGIEVFIGPCFTEVFAGAETDGLRFRSYGALGRASALAASGRLDVLPMPYGRLCAAFGSGELRADVVMLQAAPPRPGEPFSAGLSNDYAAAAARHAREVLIELHRDTPWTCGAALPPSAAVTLVIKGKHPPPEIRLNRLSLAERAIARRVADLIPDRATVQVGIGTIPEALMAALDGHKGLGIHSGVMGDAAVELIEAGVVTNAHKGIDPGISIANTLIGTRRLYDYAHRRREIEVRPASYTHAPDVLARVHGLVAVNGGIEVDLGGQVNTEVADGRYIGALGGGLEFARGAALSPGGRAVVALRATAGGGGVSRIVPRVAVATIPRADADTVVTEHGVAELRGATLRDRARRLIAVAAPEQRDELERAAHAMEGCARD